MLEDLLLLKKIADYFKKSNKSTIANMINEELKKEIADHPDFKELEYVKDDLKTIFVKYVSVKRRQSERLQKTSIAHNSCSRVLDYSHFLKSEKNVSKRNSLLINCEKIVYEENQENIDIENISDAEITTTYRYEESAILAHIDTNRLSEGSLRKSSFIPNIRSTPFLNRIPVINTDQVQLSGPIQNEIKIENYEETDDDDANSLIVIEDDNNFHQTISNCEYLDLNDGCDMSEISQAYEENFQKLLQESQSRTLDNTSQDLIFNGGNSNDSKNIDNNESKIDNAEDIESHRDFHNTGHLENSQQSDELFPIKSQDHIEIMKDCQNVQHECGQIDISRIQETNPNEDFVDSVHNEHLFDISQTNQKITAEIAIQCDSEELFVENCYIEHEFATKRKLSEDDNNIISCTKKRKISMSEEEEEEEEENIDLDKNENSAIPSTNISPEIEIIDLNVPPRSRNDSLSSLDTLPDEVKSVKNAAVKTKRLISKEVVIFKDDKKLDFERRILLCDGWLIWPPSILNSVFKSYDISAFTEVLDLYGEKNEVEELVTRKEFLDQCLQKMTANKLIFKLYFSKRKTNYYLKYPKISSDLLQVYDIPEQLYEDNLWNKSLGPKNGRKMCAENAPKLVEELLNVELAFVRNLVEQDVNLDEN